MKVGLEQRAGTRQTSLVNDYRPVTLVPAVSEIPSGAGSSISPNATKLLWNPAHSLAVFLATTSSRGNELYLSAFKSVCFKDDLPHLTITEFPKFSLRYCCCYVSCAVQSSATEPSRKTLSVQKVALDTRWSSSNAASLCSPAAWGVSRDTKTFWLNEGRKQNCHPVLQERQPTIELGLISPSLSEGHELQSRCGRDKHTAENAPEKVFRLFLISLFLIHISVLLINGITSPKQHIHISNECDSFWC